MKKLLFVLISGLLLSGCLSGPKPATVNPAPPQEVSVNIEISGFKFSPDSLTVKPGQIISVTNRDSVGHTVTADDGTSFESGLLGKDQSGTITAPSKPGNYPYHCAPHPNMKGTLIVE